MCKQINKQINKDLLQYKVLQSKIQTVKWDVPLSVSLVFEAPYITIKNNCMSLN